jgi:hypothetical protein
MPADGIEGRHPGFNAGVVTEPERAVDEMGRNSLAGVFLVHPGQLGQQSL